MPAHLTPPTTTANVQRSPTTRNLGHTLHVASPFSHPSFHRAQQQDGPSNSDLVRQLQGQGTITDPAIVKAYLATDRAIFLEPESEADDLDHPLEAGSAYIDMPMRHGLLHLSAPSIYGVALEALELREGQSFLNVGSGTGCVHALLLTPRSIPAIRST